MMSTHIMASDVASELGISVQRVRTLCRNGTLDAQKLGNTWLIEAESVYRYALTSSHKLASDHESVTPRGARPVALSFFSGAMGLDLGIEQAGFDIRLACEFDKYCRQTIALNRPNVALLGDITQCTADDVLSYAGLTRADEVELIFGGPPCQAFSTAGRRAGFNDDRGNVFLAFLEIALSIRPRYFVIENVRGLLSCPMRHRPHWMRGSDYPDLSMDEKPGGALNFVLATIEKAGYKCSFNLYNAANFGTPQVRERVVIVCSRDGLTPPPYLKPTHAENGEHGLKRWRTFRQAVRGLSEHHHINFPEKRLRFYRMLSEGQNWKSLPDALQREAMGNAYSSGGGKTGFLRRLAWDKPSPTLVTHPAMPATDLAHPEEDRPLSVEEYARLQEFPDNWTFAGPLIEQYKQIGNAVPGSLGFAIGTLIRELLDGKYTAPIPGFKYSRYKNTSDYEWRAAFSLKSQAHSLQEDLLP